MGDIDDWWPLAFSKLGIKAFLDLPWISWVLLLAARCVVWCRHDECCKLCAAHHGGSVQASPSKCESIFPSLLLVFGGVWWWSFATLQMTHDYHCLQAVVLCDRKCSCSDSWTAQALGGIWLYLMQFWICWEWTKQSATQDKMWLTKESKCLAAC